MKTRTQLELKSIFIQTLLERTILVLYTSLKGLKGQNYTFWPFKVVFYKKIRLKYMILAFKVVFYKK